MQGRMNALGVVLKRYPVRDLAQGRPGRGRIRYTARPCRVWSIGTKRL